MASHDNKACLMESECSQWPSRTATTCSRTDAILPFEALRQVVSSIFDMDDAAMAYCCRPGRGVEQERTHRHDSAESYRADDLWYPLFPVIELFVDPTRSMRAGKHAKRAVFVTTIIEVNPHRQHVGKNVRRRLHLPYASLVRPADKTGRLDSRGDRDHIILVPEERPVGAGNLIESKWPGPRRQPYREQE